MKLTGLGIHEGTWRGVLRRDGPDDWVPDLVVSHQGTALDGLAVVPVGPGEWRLELPIPAALICDGVQTFLVTERGGDEVLARFAFVAGAPLAEDLRAEIELLRAELDLLKRAFRRHCAESP